MVVYLDLVILSNILVDYGFLKTIALLYHEKIKWYRLLISLFFGTISLLLFLLPTKYLYNIRYIIGILMGLVAYSSKKPKKRFLMIISFYLVNISFIGSLVIFEIQNSVFIIIAFGYIILLHIFEKILKINYQNDYVVKIGNKEYYSLLDTGNNCFYQNKPIVFIDGMHKSSVFRLIDNIDIVGINNLEKVDVYDGPLLEINKVTVEVVYCFRKIDGYDIILNKVMEGKYDD